MAQDKDFFFEAKPTYTSVGGLFQTHRGWAMLRSRNHALLIPFFHKMFIERNLYSVEETVLASAWAQELSSLRSGAFAIVDNEDGIDLSAQDARATIRSWASPNCGYLRAKDEFVDGATIRIYDVDSTVAQALRFVEDLHRHQTVGAETRILDVLRKLSDAYSELNPDADEQIRFLDGQIEELTRQRQEILLYGARETDKRRAREKVLSFRDSGVWLSRDFEQLRENFKLLAREAQQMRLSDQRRSDSLSSVLNIEDALYESDQGKSFTGYLNIVNNPALREQFEMQMNFVLEHPEIKELLGPSLRELRRMPDRWNKEVIRTQMSVANLSGHIKNFVINNKGGSYQALMNLADEALKGYASTAGMENESFEEPGLQILQSQTDVMTPMSRNLYSQREEAVIQEMDISLGDEASVSTASLKRTQAVDETRIAADIIDFFKQKAVSSATAAEIIQFKDIKHGAAEVVTYLKVMSQKPEGLIVNPDEKESIRIRQVEPNGDSVGVKVTFDLHRVMASSWKNTTAVGLERTKPILPDGEAQ